MKKKIGILSIGRITNIVPARGSKMLPLASPTCGLLSVDAYWNLMEVGRLGRGGA